MSYLETLSNEDNKKLECPFCLAELATSWQMLPCCHCMCNSCFSEFIRRQPVADLQRCPVSRCSFKLSEVVAVKLNGSELSADPVNRYTLDGINLTFKTASVMKSIVSLLDENSANKIVVFSGMISILERLSQVMKQVKMQHILISTNCDVERGIVQFKKNTNIKVLLLPLCYGVNGLNLVEANHVFFMEPTQFYLQARSRVFRMGQTRDTTIHHVVTKDTIEEPIYQFCDEYVNFGFTRLEMNYFFELYDVD